MNTSERKAALAEEYRAIRNEAKEACKEGDVDQIVERMKAVSDRIEDWRCNLLALVASELGVTHSLLEVKCYGVKSDDLYQEYLANSND